MPDATPPPLAEGAVCPAPQALTRDQIDAVLADFRTWLEQLPGTADAPVSPATAAEPPDLHTLLGQFTALRHEVNLQTRSSRTQQEQNTEALRQLSAALEALQRREEAAAERQDMQDEELLRPLLKTLVDIYDALALARREIQRVRETVLPELKAMKDLLPHPPVEEATPPPRRSIWARLFRVPVDRLVPPAPPSVGHAEAREVAARAGQSAARVGPMLTALLTGYTMGMQRVERALQQHELEPIPAVGQSFDPERMEAVEVVTEPGRATSEVIEEVRRGYLWHDRVFRFAQVRVARPE